MFDLDYIIKIVFTLPVIILIPLATAFVSLLLSKVHKILRDIISVAGVLLMLVIVFFSRGFLDGYYFTMFFSNAFQTTFIFNTNTLTWIFNLITLSVGFCVILSSLKNVRDKSYATPFHFLIHIVIFGMLIITYSRDFLSFFIGWEVMTIASFFLINLSKPKTSGGILYFIISNIISAYLIIYAMMYIHFFIKDFSFQSVTLGFSRIKPLFQFAIIGFLFCGVSIKVGLMPLHVWIKDSYNDAPDAFTPFLSSAVSKTGIYAFIIFFYGIFGRTFFNEFLGKFLNGSMVGYIIAWLGVITSIVATFKAITQDEIKKLLAYSSIAQMGYIVTALGVANSTAVGGAVFHSINHAVIKALLFITVSGIIHRTGKTKFHELGGLIYKMPLSFFGVLIGIIGLAGMPPLAGFSSKWMIYTSLVENKWIILLMGMILSSTGAFLYCYKLIYGIFLGQPTAVKPSTVKEVHPTYWIPMILLMLLLVVFGAFPGLLTVPINTVLEMINMPLLGSTDIGSLMSPIGGFNAFIVMSVFGGAFVVVFLLFSLSNRSKSHNLHRLDIAYSGEIPDEETPLHYGYGMGKELRRIPLIGFILKHSAKKVFDFIARQIEGIAEFFRGIYSGDGQRSVIMAVSLFVIIIIVLLFI